MTAVAKDLHRLIRRVGKLTNGQASVCDMDWDEEVLDSFRVDIRPNSGFYQGGVFRFKVGFSGEYEDDDPPTVICETDIYHPNIDTTDLDSGYSNICLNILDSGTWNRKFGLEGVIIGLVYLLHNPNLDDPLGDFSCMEREDFEENVKKYLRGEEVDGRTFSADFLEKSQSSIDTERCDEIKLVNTTTNNGENSEIKDNQNAIEESKGQDVSDGKNDGDKTISETSEEHINGTDSGSNGATNCDSQIVGNVNLVTNDQTNKNDNSAYGNTDGNVQESLLNQLKEKGIQDETDSNDDSEGCTMITIDDETVVVTYEAAQLLHTQISDANAECVQVSEEQTENLTCTGATETLNLSENSNCEETDDSYNAISNILDELVENTINLCPEKEESWGTNLPILNLQTDANTKTGVTVSDAGDHVFELDNITSETGSDISTADGCDTHTVLTVEASLSKHCFTRQKSKESVKNNVHIFNNCAPYLKFILFHTFRCLTKLCYNV